MTQVFSKQSTAVALILCVTLTACAKTPDLDPLETRINALPLAQARLTQDFAQTAIAKDLAAAVQSNPQFLAAISGLRAAQARENANRAGFLPRLTLSATLSGDAASVALTPILQVLQLVYDGGALANRKIAARARVYEQRGARLELANALTMQGVQAIQDLAAAQMITDLATKNETRHRDLLAQVTARAEAGAGIETDVLTVRARLASATAQLASAQSNAAKAAAFYREIFGKAAPDKISFLPQAPKLIPNSPEDAIAHSPRILGYDAQVKAAEADLANARALWFPQAKLRGQAKSDGLGGVDTMVDMDIAVAAGARGEKASAIAVAQADLDGLIAARAAALREIQRAFDDLMAEGGSGQNRLGAMQAAVDANKDLVAASQDLFAAGRRDLLGLLEAERDLFEANQALITAQRDVGLIGYAALALTGDIIGVFGITLPRDEGAK